MGLMANNSPKNERLTRQHMHRVGVGHSCCTNRLFERRSCRYFDVHRVWKNTKDKTNWAWGKQQNPCLNCLLLCNPVRHDLNLPTTEKVWLISFACSESEAHEQKMKREEEEKRPKKNARNILFSCAGLSFSVILLLICI